MGRLVLREVHERKGLSLALSPTGVGALNLGGVTLAKFLRAKIIFQGVEIDIESLSKSANFCQKAKNADFIAIDEGQFATVDVLTALERVVRLVKGKSIMWGGCTIAIFMDVQQKLKPKFSFERDGLHKLWFFHNIHICPMLGNRRISHKGLLNWLRETARSTEVEIVIPSFIPRVVCSALYLGPEYELRLIRFVFKGWLETFEKWDHRVALVKREKREGKWIIKFNDVFLALLKETKNKYIVVGANDQCEHYNSALMDVLPGPYLTYHAATYLNTEKAEHYSGRVSQARVINRNVAGCLRSAVKLKVGAISMLLVNVNPVEGALKTLTGCIVGFDEDYVDFLSYSAIDFENNATSTRAILVVPRCKVDMLIPYARLEVAATREQIGVGAAFGITIDRAMSQTIDRVGIDVREWYPGHGNIVTAFSRGRKPEDNLILADARQIKTNKKTKNEQVLTLAHACEKEYIDKFAPNYYEDAKIQIDNNKKKE